MKAAALLAALPLSLAAFGLAAGEPTTERPPCDVQIKGGELYYPQYAHDHAVEGNAVIQCKVTAKGDGVEDCVAVEETPPGYCFGLSAVKMARYFKMKAGSAPGATFRTTVRFTLQDEKVQKP